MYELSDIRKLRKQRRKLPTKNELQEIIEEYALNSRIEIGLKQNFEVGEVPFKALAKAIHKRMRSK